jgi:hypothetical protein
MSFQRSGQMEALGKSAEGLSAVFFSAAKELRCLDQEDPDGLWDKLAADAEATILLYQGSTAQLALDEGFDPADITRMSLSMLDLAKADIQVGHARDARLWCTLACILANEAEAVGFLTETTPAADKLKAEIVIVSRELGRLFGMSPVGFPTDGLRRMA